MPGGQDAGAWWLKGVTLLGLMVRGLGARAG